MNKTKGNFLSNKWKRILFVVLAFLLLYLVCYILDPYSPYWKDYFERDTGSKLREWATSLIFCFLVSEISIFIGIRLNRYISWTERPAARLAVEAGLNLIAIFTIIIIIHLVYVYIYNDYADASVIPTNISIEETRGILQWITVSIIIAVMIMGVNIGNYLLMNWKNAAIRAAEYNQVAMEAELQSLKLQIDPHFVFNNLSVLSELILENQQLGFEYAENFSKIYRYMLVNSKKDIIPLEDELKFLHSYMFLITHRFGEGVHFEINVNHEDQSLHMPPLTLQLLVENVLKHNKTNKKDPLTVRIYTNGQNQLIVENALLPIEKPLDSSGIGIRNIIRRYSLLCNKQPQIIKDEHTFKVILPLIK
ncbi:MAG: histidine kinase [Sphingobacteriaceae bacterium]|nr:MAG: histidine kinase [Sphingobacteriaceae bacterium]